jgi:hypothetical protein
MKSIKTPKGIELPLLNLKGKDYLQVAHRLVWFREVYPLGRFDTECVEATDKYVLYKATISVPNERGEYVKLADGVKREDYAHFSDAHEKAQTGAIGRALAMIGFGTQFAPELDEGERLADSPIERPKAPQQALTNEPYVIPFGKFKGKRLEEVPLVDLQNYSNYIINKAKEDGKALNGVMELFIRSVEAMAR